MEWQLKKKGSMKLIYRLPNLEIIENFNRWAIIRSLVMISVGVVLGVLMTNFVYLTPFLGTAKEIHIYFTWIIICGLFCLRSIFNIDPRRANIANIILFSIVMFLFVFTNIYITRGFHSFK